MIYYITLDDLNNDETLFNHIYPNMQENYYWSDDYSAEFYIKAAQCGFITTSMYKDEKLILLPEIQFEYAVMKFDEIRISKKVKKLINEDKYELKINQHTKEVYKKIINYHKDSWLNNDYINILNSINNKYNKISNFKLFSVELVEKETNLLISGEIGYQVGTIYTSLTGFTSRDKKYNNCGKLQLVLLNYYLKDKGLSLWNLGHPQLQYKIDLGAKIYNRADFLKLWYGNI